MTGRLSFLRRDLWALCAAATVAGCSGSQTVPIPDAGVTDAAAPPPACDAPPACVQQGFDGVCRGGACRADVPCGADAECALGEGCVGGACRFTGCLGDGDCPTGVCRTDSYACTECGASADCPPHAKVCSPQLRCVACQQDADCPFPGPGYCEPSRGACVHCRKDEHCPSGMGCGPSGACVGAGISQPCGPTGPNCDVGLMCVTVGAQGEMCLEACSVYFNTCSMGQVCGRLTFANSASLVFEQGTVVGVCRDPVPGLKGLGESCNNNCQPHLICTPDSALTRSCKAFCDPQSPLCPPGLLCHPFPGDFSGRQYGLCYPDNGFADPCAHDGACREALACVPRDDPSTPSRLSNACAFTVGPAPAMAPCAANAQCASGHCRTDPAQGGPPFFCFGACAEDAHCAAGGRQGYCDTDFAFTTDFVKLPGAAVRGCRPGCTSGPDCAAYGPAGGYTCRTVIDSPKSRLVQTCQAPWGAALAGQSCVSASDCRDGFCVRVDGRGVLRGGVCGQPCAASGQCAAPLQCEPRALHLGAGPDGLPNTLDDRHASGAFCGAEACLTDADCAGVASRCVPDVDPAAPVTGALALACRPPTAGALLAGDGCTTDASCQSGVCAEVGTGPARACFEACDLAASDCPAALACVADGVRLRRADGTFQNFDACL